MTVNMSYFAGAGWQFFDDNGNPLTGGKLYTYAAGTSTPLTTYTSSAGSTPNTNPIVLDAAGRVSGEVWLTTASLYKFIVKTSTDVEIGTYDNIAGINDFTNALSDFANASDPAKGDALIGFRQSNASGNLTGTVNRTVHTKLQELVSLKDFGAVGDGSTNDTTAVNAAINWLNTNGGGTLTGAPGTYMVGKLTTLTASNVVLNFEGVTLKSIANALAATNDALLTMNGNNVDINGLYFDGNQSAYSASYGSQLMVLSGSGHKWHGVRVMNSPSRGVIFYCTDSEFVDCNFDNNANLGFEANAVSYLRFIGCTTNKNGCGFQKTRTVPTDTGDFAAFGHAFRFRSHHVEMVDCEAKLCGREGFYLGEGCYAFKYIGCLAWANDDGGFTMNQDPLGTGLPGDGESCYDIEYVDCEAYDNWSAGLISTAPAYNVSVIGGRYYNNHRLAGELAGQSAYGNGIYFAAGSQSIYVDGAKCYDERQFREITAVTGSGTTRTIAATGWVPGTMNYYPKVAFIAGSDGSFQGYGKIVSESAGSVTVETLPYNGVTLSSISTALFITQRVQHTGCAIDNNSQGYVKLDAFGEVKGPQVTDGYKVFVGYFTSGQNVIVDNGGGSLEPELITNPTFDTNISNWSIATPGGGGSSQATVGTGFVKSVGSLKLIAGSSVADADASLITGYLQALLGSYFKFGAWAWGASRADAQIIIYWVISGITFSSTVTHPGGGWRYLELGGFIPEGATDVVVRLRGNIGKTVYFDTVSLKPVALKTDSRDLDPQSRSLPV